MLIRTDPENMLVMLFTWQAGDCSAQEPYNGDFSAAMKGIKAKALVLPGQTDLYFRKCSLIFVG
jgi:homoserine acetyltransferase